MNVVNKIINKIKLFLFKQKEFYFILKYYLGFSPNNISYYELALSSKALGIKNKNGDLINNERLELLGDAILDAVVIDFLYHQYPKLSEGSLTETKSRIVKRETLNQLALQIGLKELLTEFSKKQLLGNHVFGNMLEAFIGAIYIDQGYLKTKSYILKKIIKPYVNVDYLVNTDINYKSQLLEWCQKYRIDIRFQILDERTNSDNLPQFRSEVFLKESPFELGIGLSKKESEQNAAKYALNRIKKREAYYLEQFLNEE